MSRWILLLLLLPSAIDSIGHPRYECGEHGRFEYCIDGVPGCIVGCHCHPGYYFDTESKICEPNAKLVEEYRRLYVPEPTRVQVPMTPPDTFETLPTPTTTSPLDNQVDAIAKDTDDLGDWLYNQFFKTIENQVINDTDDNPLTRRSGSSFPSRKPKKFRKKTKNTPKKFKFSKISKKNDLRRKLLRITEDDSLFDSESASEENSDTDSSSSDSNSDTSLEEDKDNHDNEKEHGHRKILVINKKPKPPLPSFIFLPNLETPFYPPIGLPPPPVIPMYPMVPVPPVPIYPFPTPNGDETSTQHTTTAVTGSTQSGGTTEDQKTTTTNNADSTTVTIEAEETPKPNDNADKTDNPVESFRFRSGNIKHEQRKKMLRQLRDRMKNQPFKGIPSMRNRKTTNKNFKLGNSEIPIHDNNDFQDSPFQENMRVKPIEYDPPTAAADVDFKYLSQLIHKIDPNTTNEDIKKNLRDMQKPQRRFETRYYNSEPQPNIEQNQHNERRFDATHTEPDESYYANLGQQIAFLIRKMDLDPNRQSNTDNRQGVSSQPVINDNSFASRSYWERSVRSPMNQYRPYYTNEIDNLRNLENKVEILATTAYPLSLRELENVVFLMDKAKSQLQNKIKDIKYSNNENRINLLPNEPTNKSRNDFEYFPVNEKTVVAPVNKSNMTEEYNINTRNLHYNLRGILMQNFKNIMGMPDKSKPYDVKTKSNKKNNETRLSQKKIQNRLWDESVTTKPSSVNPIENRLQIIRKQTDRSDRNNNGLNNNMFLPIVKPMSKHTRPILPPLTPMLHNLKNPKYSSTKNKYIIDKESLPFQYAPNNYIERKVPSYFHHELHHFDYFD